MSFLLSDRIGERLLALLHLSLQIGQNVQVAQSGACGYVLNLRSIVLLGSTSLLLSSLLLTLRILEGAAVAQDDALAVLVELDHLELELLALLGL